MSMYSEKHHVKGLRKVEERQEGQTKMALTRLPEPILNLTFISFLR